MSYTALYRKFRPDNFDDVKGQDHIVTTLKNQIINNRLGHAYLFCGTRGTGKTTIAKILGKAANCASPHDGNPCGECASCRAIAAGNSMNLIEIDAASNNGVDNIREIKEEVMYSPTDGKYKVYIIDEVHMLSIGAFNALLKTLEEPPAYVIFILATTEAHKIPITILSRCQRYDFRRISIDTIADRLAQLMSVEGVNVEDKAIRYVAKAADGSLRDALSLLDQCLAFYMGKDLKYENVLEVLGAVDTQVFGELLEKVLNADTTGCICALEEMVLSGRDLTQFVADFTWYMRNLLLVKTSQVTEDVIGVSRDTLSDMKQMSEKVDTEILMRYISIFSDLSGQIKFSTQKRILIEMTLIRLTRPSMDTDLGAVLDRLSQLEQKVSSQTLITPELLNQLKQSSSAAGDVKSNVQLKRKTPIRASQEDVQKVADMWKEILAGLSENKRADLSTLLKDTVALVGMGDNELVITRGTKVAVDVCDTDDAKEAIMDVVENRFGSRLELDIKFLKPEDNPESFGFTNYDTQFKMVVDISDNEEVF